ncbi:hypothetical protein C1H46_044037 [Malus baccata]|uniref:Uncharacterized protein n=1 Tax=Malus baccata TaxID=106549 RepID=A0A540K925_MALBA|nr:hypothetical protein C1H46_044037 [Malus baccata]
MFCEFSPVIDEMRLKESVIIGFAIQFQCNKKNSLGSLVQYGVKELVSSLVQTRLETPKNVGELLDGISFPFPI